MEELAARASGAPLIALFERAGDRRQVRRRASLHRAGDPVHHLWLVTQGWLARVRTAANGADAVTAVYLPGDVIGLDALSSGRLTDEVIALMDATVLRVPIEQVRAVIGDGVAADTVERLARETGFLREALIAVGSQSSTERLCTFVLQTYDRLRAAGLCRPDDRAMPWPLTQTQVGAVTGLTSVHVNRVLRRLRDDGLLDIQNGVATMLDLPALRRIAERRG